MEEKKFIVIRDAIKEKNPKLLKWLPNFVLKYVERIAHEEDLNRVIHNIGHLEGLEFIDALLNKELDIEVEVRGVENIPLSGGVIFAANHPLGGLDGIALMHAIGQYRKDIKFLVNDILMHVKNIQSLFIPVNKHGGQPRETLKIIDEYYASDQAILIFPAGLVSRKRKSGIIKDLEWKKSFIGKAKKHKKDVIPVYIEGKNSNFFYNLARFRKQIGINVNIEMFYLVDEFFGQKDNKIVIHIGEPISYTQFDKSKSEQEWADYVKDVVYAKA